MVRVFTNHNDICFTNNIFFNLQMQNNLLSNKRKSIIEIGNIVFWTATLHNPNGSWGHEPEG